MVGKSVQVVHTGTVSFEYVTVPNTGRKCFPEMFPYGDGGLWHCS